MEQVFVPRSVEELTAFEQPLIAGKELATYAWFSPFWGWLVLTMMITATMVRTAPTSVRLVSGSASISHPRKTAMTGLT